MATYFVTGASRGLGLGICTALAARPATEVSAVFAAVRTETDALKRLIADSSGRVQAVSVDVTSENSVKGAAAKVEHGLGNKGLDAVVNAAGVMDFVPDGIEHISSTLGSISMAATFSPSPAPAYKVSKAALNMLTVQYALSLKNEGFTAVVISPGWVKTDMGSSRADLDIETSIKATLDIVDRVGASDTGKFFNIHVPAWEDAPGMNQYDGGQPPW